MVQRIALTVLLLFVFAGFKAPHLPRESRRVYTFEPVAYGRGFKTQTGGLFSLTIGFRRAETQDVGTRHSHRDRADDLVSRLEKRLNKVAEPSDAEVRVAKLYPSTREIILNVSVADSSRVDAVKAALIANLSKIPGVSFVGEPGVMEVEK